ncbi:helix-turn-helix domain-containing protein [Leptolyngbya sp. FACHB-541]|uniref:helix-turn-helix domain-containing protein n=1 Tax=Leptolyngbya sp. FACHB-541 TaxID=2692810 RepID=UPI001681E95B|nr:helix-turn-helix domain-containing protein [Leptolyngbya sp. FACHB-541]MBD1995034.1 helix-turn-helix domain-containing protein [Leptolyngbya sp. FACHB-541]
MPDLEQLKISTVIRNLRQELGLTQEKLAARLGVTCLTVNRWENGRASPSPMACRLLEAMLEERGDRNKTVSCSYSQDS